MENSVYKNQITLIVSYKVTHTELRTPLLSPIYKLKEV